MNARQREKTPELIDKLIRGIPLRRIGTPEEIAHAVVDGLRARRRRWHHRMTSTPDRLEICR
jgi:NAD(P)-dependent dehydrogenase (short-subunit alcohol dehydrogenase family)